MRKIGVFSILVYLAQGISQHFALVSQPFTFFLKEGLRLDAFQVSLFYSALMLPWILKPFYCFFCDFYSLWGYRRLSYVLLGSLTSGFSFLGMALLLWLCPLGNFRQHPGLVWVLGLLLLLATTGMALLVALAVGIVCGEAREKSRLYFSLQGLSYYLVNIPALYCGGLFCEYFPAPRALGLASLVAAVPPLVVALWAASSLGEAREEVSARPGNWQGEFGRSLKALLANRAYMITLAFLCLWNFSPSMGTSLYFYELDSLGFSQKMIGDLGALTSLGMFVGALIFPFFLRSSFQTRSSLLALVFLGISSTLSYLFLRNWESALLIEFFRGFSQMIFTLALYGLASDVSPRRVAVTAMALIICFYNLAQELAIFCGGFLFTYCFHRQFMPLVVVSAATTALCFCLVDKIISARLAAKV